MSVGESFQFIAPNGQYIVQAVRRAIRPDKHDRSTVVVCNGAADVLPAVSRYCGRYTALVLRTLGSAAVKDDMLAAVIAKELG